MVLAGFGLGSDSPIATPAVCPAVSDAGSQSRSRSPGGPKALFLDEPTAGMDASARRRRSWRDIVSFAAEGGAVLLTTQQLAEAEEIATRVVLLARGRVMLEGTVSEIRARGRA